MSRSSWKINFISSSVLKLNNKKKRIVWNRSSCIPFFLVDSRVRIYNGKDFKNILVTKEMVGYKFGEFSLTRKSRPKKLIEKKKNYGSKSKSSNSKK